MPLTVISGGTACAVDANVFEPMRAADRYSCEAKRRDRHLTIIDKKMP